MSKIQINKGDLLRIVESTIRAIINENGVRELLELDLTKEEQEKLDNSCNLIKKMRENSIEKIIES